MGNGMAKGFKKFQIVSIDEVVIGIRKVYSAISDIENQKTTVLA